MLGTRVDAADEPRLIESERGWWFIGNGTWTLLRTDQVGPDGTVRADVLDFLRGAGAFRERVPSAFSLTVLTSTACNLGCGYCFQNTALDPRGGNMPLRIDRKRLTVPTIDTIIAFTRGRMERAGLDQLDLLLFGGEPLLNPRGCVQLMERAAPIGMRSASMVSNGVLLTERLARQLSAAGLRGVQITFDGSRADHDQIRVRHDGGESFDDIVRNVERATEVTGLRWGFRVNVSHRNIDRIDALFDQLAGRVDPARVTMSFAWVGDAGLGYGNDLRHVDAVGDRFHRWNVTALAAGYLVTRPSMRTTCQICTVPGGDLGAVVNADGTLYSCWQSAGKDAMAVGTLAGGYDDPAALGERWVSCGYEYDQGDPAVAEQFQDRLDARLLDHLFETGRIGSPGPVAAGR
jgi:uncharacterized protein